MVDAPRAKASLCNFKATAFAQQQVAHWHSHVFQLHFHVAMGRIVVAEHREGTQDGDARRVGGGDGLPRGRTGRGAEER